MYMENITSRVEILTPKRAQELLDTMGPNRNLKLQHVRNLCDAIIAGEWALNGESIKIGRSGRMIDGQHRCTAVVETGISIRTLVTYGVPDQTFPSIDGGRPRTNGDVLSVDKMSQPSLVAAALGWLNRYLNGKIRHAGHCSLSHTHTVKMLTEHPGIVESVPFGRKVKRLMPGSIATFLHYWFSMTDQELADRFFNQLATGDGISQGDPDTSGIFALRRRLEDSAMKMSKQKLTPVYVYALTVKAWNATRSRSVINHLVWKNSGERQEPLPEIK